MYHLDVEAICFGIEGTDLMYLTLPLLMGA